jgi:hypothetical protein
MILNEKSPKISQLNVKGNEIIIIFCITGYQLRIIYRVQYTDRT